MTRITRIFYTSEVNQGSRGRSPSRTVSQRVVPCRPAELRVESSACGGLHLFAPICGVCSSFFEVVCLLLVE